MSLLVDKYKPKKINDIKGNKLQIKRVKKWLSDFENKKEGTKTAILFSGPPGIGKTTLATLLLQEYKYDLIEYNASDIRNQKLVKENLKSIMGKISISSLMGGNKKLGIIMDEVDGMSSGDKGGISELISFINPNKGKRKKNRIPVYYTNPIICICNNDSEKKMRDLKKECEFVKFSLPSVSELYDYAVYILNKEKINIDDNEIIKIVNFCQKDIRKMISLIEQVMLSKNTKIEEILNSLDKKYQDNYLNDSVFNILNNYIGVEEITRIFNSDKNLIGLNINENIFDFMKNYKNDEKSKFEILKEIFSFMSFSDLFDKEIFSNCSYTLQEYNAVFKCCVPSFLLNEKTKYSTLKFTNNDIKFTKILSKFSLQYNNYKNKIFINRKFNLLGNKSELVFYLYLIKSIILDYNKIKINGFQENKKIKYILERYNLCANDLEKINKLIIQSSKNTKYEKDLSQLAGKDIDKKYFEKYLKYYL